MLHSDYDVTSQDSILEYAKRLFGKTLEETVDVSGWVSLSSDKGDLGKMVEQLYFQFTPSNAQEPDFAEAKVELKVAGVKRSKDAYKAKERLVLTMIDYVAVVREVWESNTLMKKCSVMLLIFYLYDKEMPVYKRKFVYEPLIWRFPNDDLRIIKRDWEIIQKKILAGKAHEISEGDTFYLGACRKGSGGIREGLRYQPFSTIKAKSRAFSLKPSYVNTILDKSATESELLQTSQDYALGIETVTSNKFKSFIGKSIEEISIRLNIHKKGKNDKGFYRRLTLGILGVHTRTVPELEKAGIEMKTIRLNSKDMPKEDMSFPVFGYMDIIQEKWENSVFFQKIEQKFLFVIFKYDNNEVLRFHGLLYWNMPYEDRQEARKVWQKTKRQIANHRAEFLPKSSESRVAHVRPHGRNNRDTLPTPEGKMLVKKCFWLNKKYLAEQLRQSSIANIKT